MNNIKILEEKIKIIESLCTDDCINKSTVIQPLKYAIENLIQENKELKQEQVLNEKILYFANNTICNYHEGYQAGLHKEITATEIVAEEKERFIIGQEIKRLKDSINELHNKLDEGNKRVKEDYIPKSKIINLVENEVIDISGFECISARDLQELLEEGE